MGKATNQKKKKLRKTYCKWGQEKRRENNKVRFNLDKAETAAKKGKTTEMFTLTRNEEN